VELSSCPAALTLWRQCRFGADADGPQPGHRLICCGNSAWIRPAWSSGGQTDGVSWSEFRFRVVWDSSTGRHRRHSPPRRVAERLLPHRRGAAFLLHTGRWFSGVSGGLYEAAPGQLSAPVPRMAGRWRTVEPSEVRPDGLQPAFSLRPWQPRYTTTSPLPSRCCQDSQLLRVGS